MAAWRYWRIYITDDNGGGGCDVSKITMDIATVDQTDPTEALTAATASTFFDGTTTPPKAFDASLTTRWASDFVSPYPQWIQYDFGLGTERALDRITYRVHSSAARGPRDFIIQASQNAIDWTPAYEGSGVTWSSATETKSWEFTSPDPTSPNPRVSQINSQILAETLGQVQVSQLSAQVLWGISSAAQVSQISAQILGRAPVRRTIGITH